VVIKYKWHEGLCTCVIGQINDLAMVKVMA